MIWEEPRVNDTTVRNGGFRHLIYFIDGTWLWAGNNEASSHFSNVYKTNLLLYANDHDGNAQIVHYMRGLGAETGMRKYTAGGFAYGIDRDIADLYINICSNYEEGDKIYIFGFSRGAVVARALTGLLARGILKPGYVNLFPHLWDDFTHTSLVGKLFGRSKRYLRERPGRQPINYKDYCWKTNPRIDFLGVLDTVSGRNNNKKIERKLRLDARNVQENVINAVHILSIDESRLHFRPVLWSNSVELDGLHLEQIWMPGVHSDVGGSYSDSTLGDRALVTLVDRCLAKTSLKFDTGAVEALINNYEANSSPQIHDEHEGWWKMLRWFKHRRSPPKNVLQHLHPFARRLHRRPVRYKSQRYITGYRLSNAFRMLPDCEEFISDDLRRR